MRARGQMLAFEPPRYGREAARSAAPSRPGLSGPRRPYAGAVRDFVLGVRVARRHRRGPRVRRPGHEERRRLRRVAADDRRARHARRHHRGVAQVPAAAARRDDARVRVLGRRGDPPRQRMGRQPLPVSATCFHDGRLCGASVGRRSPRSRAAMRKHRRQRVSPTPDAFWATRARPHACASSRRRATAACRCGACRCESTAPYTDLGGEQLIEWGGALRWLASGRARRRRQGARVGGRARRPRDAVPRRRQVGRRVPAAAPTRARAAPAAEGGVRSARHPESRPPHPPSSDADRTSRPSYRDTPEGREADAILRACVHCGFCTATCPTYQLLGDELDGPRGRIYLIKQVLEGGDRHGEDAAAPRPLPHLPQLRDDVPVRRASTAGSSTSAASIVDDRVGRTPAETARSAGRCAAALLSKSAVRRRRSRSGASRKAVAAARARRPHSVGARGRRVAARRATRASGDRAGLRAAGARAEHRRRDRARARPRRHLGDSRCDGRRLLRRAALSSQRPRRGAALVRRNIDAWWPHVERGAEAIVVTASGCGVMVKDYGHVLRARPGLRRQGARIAALARDPIEIVRAEWTRVAPLVAMDQGPQRIAFHSPCSLQHGMKIRGRSRNPAARLGHSSCCRCADAHLCCGSAGTYSILQPELAARAQGATSCTRWKRCGPDVIATANIGCMTHLAVGHAHAGAALDRAARQRAMIGRSPRPVTLETARASARTRAATIRHFLAIPTRWMDNDAYGHVNNVTYYSYFDTVGQRAPDPRGRPRHRARRRRSASSSRPRAASTSRCRFPSASTPACASRASARRP